MYAFNGKMAGQNGSMGNKIQAIQDYKIIINSVFILANIYETCNIFHEMEIFKAQIKTSNEHIVGL